MRNNDISILGIARRLSVACLLLFALAGNTIAQTDGQFVIKKNGHYLAHVQIEATMPDHFGQDSTYWYWVLRDVDFFHPDSCLWFSGPTFNPSGTNHNYYFYDGTNYRFLAAPLASNGALSLSESLPSTSMLRNTDQIYYFFDWDPDEYGRGVARGHKHNVTTEEACTACNGDWHLMENGSYQCWEAYWVELKQENGNYWWELSTESQYNITTNGGRFRDVAVTPHPQDTNVVAGSGLADLEEPFEMEYQESPLTNHPLSATVSNYVFSIRPEYTTYVFEGATHNYYDGQDHGNVSPDYGENQTYQASSASYSWTITDGSTYLSFSSSTTSPVTTSTDPAPTLYYINPNNGGHRTATLTLTVTYGTGANAPQQVKTTTVTVKTPCQNPGADLVSAEVNNLGAIISWAPTAESYVVSWRKLNTTAWSSATVSNATSYTITGLEYGTTYQYKVKATCGSDEPTIKTFTTVQDPGLLVAGSIFGGGRMADVDGKTEVVVINCGEIDAVYGGNDIAGTVHGLDGSTITLGVNANDSNANAYNEREASTSVRVHDVYGGGNGYYAYNGTSFVPATSDYTSETVAVGASVNIMTPEHQVGGAVWTNTGADPKTLNFPSIVKTAITVTNDKVKVDSLFGGAKNAFVTHVIGGTPSNPQYVTNGSTITVNGGTIYAVFGGNNFGGTQGYGKHHIDVTSTKTDPTATTGFGRDFGIAYLFGGGNKVYGSTTEITITGGQCDTVFAGGNSASVYAANVTVDCEIGASSGTNTYGKIFTQAINSYTSPTVFTVKDYPAYAWDGSGVYNVRTLFGGNNKAEMSIVPTVTLTSGSIGTVYGGGNAGDMLAQETDDCTNDHNPLVINEENVKYSTHVILDQPTVFVDYLYGGCQMSNVDYSTWVEMKNGHVGTVYGGCNVSGDVGSARVNPNATSPSEDYQEVQGGTFVVATGGTVYKDLFAGSNGYYHCSQDGIHYSSGINYGDPQEHYVGMTVPTHNETHVVVKDDILVKGNVYAGGNLACVGFLNVTAGTNSYPWWVGFASVRMSGGTVKGNVFGGGNMASIYGSNEVQVSGGSIEKALYGGNDRTGQVAQFSNRVLPSSYDFASDGRTSLKDPEVHTYVSLTGDPEITTVYGGGNGYYAYFESFEQAAAYSGPLETVVSCNQNDAPIQTNTFVDVNINGGADGGHIGTVYGGGDGVTVTGFITVFFNVDNPIYDPDHNNVETIFGGNNKGDLALTSNIILLFGQVGTVYGGCNQGAMTASGINTQSFDIGDSNYENIGSYVRLIRKYDPDNSGQSPNITAKVTEAVYGGCRMNGVDNNSLVLVEGGNFSGIPIFGGSDVSGDVGGWSRVVVSRDAPEGSGCTVGNVYGGGNGNYVYENNNVYTLGNVLIAEGTEGHPITAPTCANSGVDVLCGQVGAPGEGNEGNVFGGGLGPNTSTTGDVEVNIGIVDAANANACPVIYGAIYGGSALGEVNTDGDDNTTVNFWNGTLHGNLYGGGLGNDDHAAKVKGKVFVYISTSTQDLDHCFIDLRDADIYGCNNANGSPQDDVTVNVYKTGYTTGDYGSQTGTLYAIHQVFGGGNQADYRPVAVEQGDPHKAHVIIHDCLNSIWRVFSGGNAAYAETVAATIEGGRMEYVFGGGNGESGTAADIGFGGTHLLVEAGIIEHLFGGSNEHGDVLGVTNTEINGDLATQACKEEIIEFFGGSNVAPLGTPEHPATINAVVDCGTGFFHEIYGGSKQAAIIGDVTLSIKGGECDDAFGGSKGDLASLATVIDPDHADVAANITGNVTLNLEGGKIKNAFGGSNYNGNITGNIVVNVIDYEAENCALDLTNVYGGGNVTAYTPTNASAISPIVNVMHIKQADGVRGNVFGGAKGATATVTANPRVNIGYVPSMLSYLPDDHPELDDLTNFPRAYVKGHVVENGTDVYGGVFGGGDLADVHGNIEVNIYNGEVVHKVVGGGNSVGATGVTGNVTLNISGGNLCTGSDIEHVGIYGGCNESGTVGGVFGVTLNITGTAVIGNETNVTAARMPVNVHGGGFGQGTSVTHNVLVNYGDIEAEESEFPKLFGDLYGGSALGSVNSSNTDNTIVNVYNGSLIGKSYTVNENTYYYSGNVYGGGLGQKAVGTTTPAIPAVVNGTVHVNIGHVTTAPSTGLEGKATLIGCNVYGCNNQNGSPQGDVYVDVYQTAHIPANLVSGRDYAILHVFGGGNEAHYAPENNNPHSQKRTHLYIHGCDNTIKYSYGGGNAADAVGVETIIEGGRFDEVYGGGNGLVTAANIGEGSVGFIILAGHVGFLFEGSNKEGNIGGTPYVPELPEGYVNCGILIVDSYYFGDNEAEHYGDIVNTITCEQASQFNYKYVYAGSRWAIVYGDVKLTVQGGNIRYLFGGSKGYSDDHKPAHIRMFPSSDDIYNDLLAHPGPGEDTLQRKYSYGLRKFMGYPDHFKTNLVGKGGNIELIVNGGTIGEVIGGCDELGNVEGKITVIVDEIDCSSCPLFVGNVYGANYKADVESIYTDPDGIATPKVNIVRGQIGGPPVTFYYDPSNEPIQFEGNVFGGGDEGNVTSNPKVIIGDGTTTTPVDIKGNVFGGGNLGNVDGSPKVVIVPEMHELTFDNENTTGGTFTVSYSRGTAVTSPANIGEDVDLVIEAIPIPATDQGGYLFEEWSVTPTSGTSVGGATVGNPNSTHTLFTMGTEDVTLAASFRAVPSHLLTLESDPANVGTFTVNGFPCSGSNYVAEGSTVTVHAIHAQGYIFKEWTVAGAELSSTLSATTSFVVEGPVTLTAHFVPVYDLTLVSDPFNAFTFKVNGSNYTGPVSLKHGDRVTVEAVPATGVTFHHWTCEGEGAVVGHTTQAVTSFTMGTEDATMTAHQNRRTNNNTDTEQQNNNSND